MARLCSQISQVLEDNVLKKLHVRGIYTVVEFLQEDPEKLVHITNLPYKEILQVRRNITAYYAAFPRNGIDNYNELVLNTALIPTGIESLDNMTEGGFLTGKMYELCGPSGSGKTQLCHTISANIVLNFNQRIYYIDTKRDFSGKRIQEILGAKGCHDEVIGAVMEKIQVTRIQNIYELLSFLQHLKSTIHHEQDGNHSVRLIILDSLPVLFFQFLGKNLNDGLGLMNQLANTIKYIITEYHVTFLVVNLAVQSIEEENLPAEGNTECLEGNLITWDMMKPALGKYWLDVPCTRLFIHKIDLSEIRQIAVMKSTNLAAGKCCNVSICTKGVTSA